MVYVCVGAQCASTHHLFPRIHTTACARRVAEGWLRERIEGWSDGGDGNRTVEGWSNERCCGRGAVARRGQHCKARPGGWHGSGASLCPSPPCPSWSFCGQHLQPALHAKHTLQRGRLHMGLRGPEEKHSWGCAGRRGRWVSSTTSLSLSQCLSKMKRWGDAVMRDERINSPQIILLWIWL